MDFSQFKKPLPILGKELTAEVVDAHGEKREVPIVAAVMTPAGLQQLQALVDEALVAALTSPEFHRIVENAVHNALTDAKKNNVIQFPGSKNGVSDSHA